MEPRAATAHHHDGGVTVWPSSQNPFGAKESVARALDLPQKRVRIIAPFLGGGFGDKTRNIEAVQAARLSKAVKRPVQVSWSREDEFFYDFARPAAVVKVKGALDKSGKLSAWDFAVYHAGQRGSATFYDVPNHRTVSLGGRGVLPLPTGAWRAPGNNTNTWAREHHMDRLAKAAGHDPITFRLAHLNTDRRMRAVLEAAQKAWGKKLGQGDGTGIALGIDAGTYVALIAQVDVDKRTGAVQVNRVLVVQDMGLVVNPQGARIQAEGCVVMGLGYTLSEELEFKGGEVVTKNFNTYALPRFSWTPDIDVVLLDRQDQPPQGGGEPAIIAVGGAVANAIYDATGVSVTRLPMTPSRVRTAIQQSPKEPRLR